MWHYLWQEHRETARPLGLVVALFVLLGFIYSVTTPIFEAPDEAYHYPLVEHLADGEGLPVQDGPVVGPWRQEGGQPPLYYALAALLTRGIDTGDMARVHRLNPHADLGVIRPDGNVNRVIHGRWEAWPYRGTVLAVHVARWLSLSMGVVTVVAAYLLGHAIFPDDPLVSLTAAVLTAFNSMYLFVTSSVNNDALVIMLASLCLWQMVRLLPNGGRHSGGRLLRWIVLGVLLGLAALSKLSGLGLLALAGLTALLVAWRRRSMRLLVRNGLALVLPVLAIAGWWYLRNWRLYGDPLGLSAFVAIIGARHPTPTLLQLWGEARSFVMSYWGFYGWLNVPAPEWVYGVLVPLGALALLAAPIYLWQRHRARREGALGAPWLQIGLVALWPLILFVSLIRWTRMTPASQGRLLFPGLSALSLLMAMGLSVLPRGIAPWGRLRGVVPGLAGGLLFAIAALMPLGVIGPAYAPPAPLDDATVAAISHPRRVIFGDRIALLGYDLPRDAVLPGEAAPLTLYWECLAPMEHDYSVFVHLAVANDLIIGQRDRFPGRGLYVTSQWRPGERFAETFWVPVSETALTPTEADLVVGFYRYDTGERLPITSADGDHLGDAVALSPVRLPSRVVEGIPNPVHLNLEDRVALVGYDLDRTVAAPGESLALTLYWRALRDLDVNYSVFTQVIGEGDRIWAQQDGWPQGGDAPTATWRQGQLIRDGYELAISDEAPPGVYDLQVGMYNSDGRLDLLGETGYVRDTRILLGKIRVVAP